MHITLLDGLYYTLAFLFLLTSAVICALLCVAPITTHYLGTYHVLIDFFSFLFFFGAFSGLLVQLSLKIAPLQRGEFPMDHQNSSYWKYLAMVAYNGRIFLVPLTLLALRPAVLKLFGGKIGSDNGVAGYIDCPFLVTLGDGCAVGNGSQICGSIAVNDKLLIGDVKLGKNVTIGMNSVILPNVEIGDNAVVEIGSVVLPGSRIPSGERWRGNPARKWMLN